MCKGDQPHFLDLWWHQEVKSTASSGLIVQVAGVIETTRPDAKNAQYQSAIKHGDLLLNRLQKLSKVIDDTF